MEPETEIPETDGEVGPFDDEDEETSIEDLLKLGDEDAVPPDNT